VKLKILSLIGEKLKVGGKLKEFILSSMWIDEDVEMLTEWDIWKKKHPRGQIHTKKKKKGNLKKRAS